MTTTSTTSEGKIRLSPKHATHQRSLGLQPSKSFSLPISFRQKPRVSKFQKTQQFVAIPPAKYVCETYKIVRIINQMGGNLI